MSGLRVAQGVAWALTVQALLLLGVVLLQSSPVSPSVVVISTRTEWAGLVANRINTTPGHPVRAFVGTTTGEALDDLRADRTQGVLLVDPSRAADELTVSSVQGTDAAATVSAVVGSAVRAEGRQLASADLTEFAVGDPGGRHAHQLLLAWIISGLVLGALTTGARRPGLARELLACALLGALGALLSAMSVGIVCLVVASWTQDAAPMFLIGVIVVWASALLARAASVGARGVALLAVSAALLVVAANPIATGADGFGRAGPIWAPIGPLTLPGAAMSALRRVAYVDRPVSAAQWATLAWWCAVGVLAAVLANSGWTGERSDNAR
ncbi:hypothetical protein IEE94_02535 [Yimella sp. cx-573]|nr:hypothetical protein [Yimella sp. cx-573]